MVLTTSLKYNVRSINIIKTFDSKVDSKKP